MADIGYPIIEQVNYDKNVPDELNNLVGADVAKRRLLLEYPTVYVIYSPNKRGGYEVYVGETNDIDRRTSEHLLEDPKKREDWKELSFNHDAQMLIIGHHHFNKSLTMDIENKMMLYMLSTPSVKRLNNRRENQQNEYYTSDEKEQIFSRIWRKLRKFNDTLFPVETIVKDSPIFKASPFHDLTMEQERAKEIIIDEVIDALLTQKTGQLILVEGEAGSGKTVLLSTIFYLISQLKSTIYRPGFDNLNNYLLVNHKEQLKVYEDIINKLELNRKNKDTTSSPTHFINQHSESNKADVVLIDEAHLLLTQGKQSYGGKNQLNDILKRSRVVVAVFDKNQILQTNEYLEPEQIKKLEDTAQKKGNLISLTNQLRIHANTKTISWIRDIVDKGIITDIPHDKQYDLRIFDDPVEMYDAIREKDKDETLGVSRLLATFDWDFNGLHSPKNQNYWMVTVGNLSLPWNLQINKIKKGRHSKNKLSWIERPETIGEVGSTFTIQGFDLNYSGLIIGPSVQYRNGHIKFDPSKSKNTNATHLRTLHGKKVPLGQKLLPNELNVLLTRGVNGMYIYAVDDELRAALLKAQKQRGK
ncbi:MAG: DNA/RNA helicase domain-containing protein [Lentilactobacillus diolivorans]